MRDLMFLHLPLQVGYHELAVEGREFADVYMSITDLFGKFKIHKYNSHQRLASDYIYHGQVVSLLASRVMMSGEQRHLLTASEMFIVATTPAVLTRP